jgi:hypothetical protein
VAYVRTVKTASGATAVQIVHGSRRGARDIEHLGSAHDEQAVEALKAVARQRLAGGQGEIELGVQAIGTSGACGVVDAPPQGRTRPAGWGMRLHDGRGYAVVRAVRPKCALFPRRAAWDHAARPGPTMSMGGRHDPLPLTEKRPSGA